MKFKYFIGPTGSVPLGDLHLHECTSFYPHTWHIGYNGRWVPIQIDDSGALTNRVVWDGGPITVGSSFFVRDLNEVHVWDGIQWNVASVTDLLNRQFAQLADIAASKGIPMVTTTGTAPNFIIDDPTLKPLAAGDLLIVKFNAPVSGSGVYLTINGVRTMITMGFGNGLHNHTIRPIFAGQPCLMGLNYSYMSASGSAELPFEWTLFQDNGVDWQDVINKPALGHVWTYTPM
jgi:hypothetical protein